MAVTPHDGSTTFSFAGANYTVTNIVVTNTDPAANDTIDVSHLGITAGNSVLTQSKPLSGSANDTGRQLVVDYLGATIIRDATTGTLSLTIAGSSAISSAAATVTTSTLTLATNDVVKGQVTFKVARY